MEGELTKDISLVQAIGRNNYQTQVSSRQLFTLPWQCAVSVAEGMLTRHPQVRLAGSQKRPVSLNPKLSAPSTFEVKSGGTTHAGRLASMVAATTLCTSLMASHREVDTGLDPLVEVVRCCEVLKRVRVGRFSLEVELV